MPCISLVTHLVAVARIRCQGVSCGSLFHSPRCLTPAPRFSMLDSCGAPEQCNGKSSTRSDIYPDFVWHSKYHYRSGYKEDHTARYFSHNNPEASLSRDRLAEDSLEMLIKWLKDGGNVGIHGTVAPSLLSSGDPLIRLRRRHK